MVSFQQRKSMWIQLGKLCRLFGRQAPWTDYSDGITETEYTRFNSLIETVKQENGWFTPESVRSALSAWGDALEADKLEQWLSAYTIADQPAGKTVAVIGAGNIPFVAMHDILCAVVSGHRALVKYASDDRSLIPGLLSLVGGFIDGEQPLVVEASGKLEQFDAVIATGSNNSARYFEYYFGKYPHLIRKHRNSIAVLDGTETNDELFRLGADIFGHYGLGCRNVTQLWVPDGFVMDRFFEAIYPYNEIIMHNKYANNYDYNKAIWLLNKEDLLDNGFLLLKQDSAIASPTASLFWQSYQDESEVNRFLEAQKAHLQCVVGHGHIAFGQAQCPALWDYADGVDTLAFLAKHLN